MKELLIPGILSDREISQILDYAEVSFHHEDDGHHVNVKPNYLPGVAAEAFARLASNLDQTIQGMDPWMKFYRLGHGKSGIVLPHMDEDFCCPNRYWARWSVLFYLGGTYEGGETVFETDRVISHPAPGSVMIFPHNLLHEGRPITDGTKYILKTDLYGYDT